MEKKTSIESLTFNSFVCYAIFNRTICFNLTLWNFSSMLSCQIKTKCWFERYHVTCGNAWTMAANKLMDIPMTQKNYRLARLETNNQIRWIKRSPNGHKFSCISFPWNAKRIKVDQPIITIRNSFNLQTVGSISLTTFSSHHRRNHHCGCCIETMPLIYSCFVNCHLLLHNMLSIKVINKHTTTNEGQVQLKKKSLLSWWLIWRSYI